MPRSRNPAFSHFCFRHSIRASGAGKALILPQHHEAECFDPINRQTRPEVDGSFRAPQWIFVNGVYKVAHLP